MLLKPVVTALLSGVLAGCVSTPRPALPKAVPTEWMAYPRVQAIPAVAFDADGRAVTRLPLRNPLSDGEVNVVDGKISRGSEALTPPYAAVDSLDVSEDRREIVFSAKRENSFDIGLVSLDGSHVNWVPEENLDEIAVQWAPRGNKVSYVVRARSGDLVRTVHIPTSFQLSVDVPWGRVTDLAWDAPAERYAIIVDSIDASPHVQVMKYDGTARTTAIEPQKRLDISIEPFGAALMLRPSSLKYGQRLPLVVWLTDADRNRWNDARAHLLTTTRSAILIASTPPDAGLQQAIAETKWVDTSHVFIVDAREKGSPFDAAPGQVVIRANSSIPAGRWLRSGSVVETAGSVESFAAGFIAEQLKGISSTNGHR
jgi:hypothetical protein